MFINKHSCQIKKAWEWQYKRSIWIPHCTFLEILCHFMCRRYTFSSASDRLNLVDPVYASLWYLKNSFFDMKWCHNLLKDSSNLILFTFKYCLTMPKYHRVIFMISSLLKLFLILIFETYCLSTTFFLKSFSFVTLPCLLHYFVCFPTIDIYVIFFCTLKSNGSLNK